MSKTRRLNRILGPDGKALIVAMDHGAIQGPAAGIARPGETIRQAIAGGADAILCTFGVAREFAKELARVGVILRSDGGSSSIGPRPTYATPVYSVEDALRLGADGIVTTAGPGHADEMSQLEWLAQLASECEA
jgi:DhnA family fructose-bisphosphate aldolase class Ia